MIIKLKMPICKVTQTLAFILILSTSKLHHHHISNSTSHQLHIKTTSFNTFQSSKLYQLLLIFNHQSKLLSLTNNLGNMNYQSIGKIITQNSVYFGAKLQINTKFYLSQVGAVRCSGVVKQNHC